MTDSGKIALRPKIHPDYLQKNSQNLKILPKNPNLFTKISKFKEHCKLKQAASITIIADNVRPA